MQDTPLRAVITFDVQGSTRLTRTDQDKLLRGIQYAISELEDFDVNVLVAGDGGVLAFDDAKKAYNALKSLIYSWVSAKKEFIPPVLVGLKLALHAGPILMNRAYPDVIVGPTIEEAYSVMMAGPPDIVQISDEAFSLIETLITSEHVRVVARNLRLHDGTARKIHEIAFSEFLRSDQYIVRLEPPVDLLLLLAKRPEQIYTITPRKFEEVIAQLLADFGYEIELTKQTRDSGIDIIAIRRDTGLKLTERYLVQCKRNAPKNKIGISVVHELLGVGIEEPHTGLIVVTTSTFTRPVLDLARKESVRWYLHLKDYASIQEWLFEYSKKRS